MDDCKIYWELPATAHFCSLFRNVFKLLDFDIDDLEEALTFDTDCAADGGRSTLVVDLLIALIKGCLGRKDISLLSYNCFLWDLLQIEWVNPGIGANPLGQNREKANFHSLPKHVKIKLLWFLCEWRLQRADVETLTKNLSGDSLRIQPLGKDDNQAVYWYFFGTRLYKEDSEPQKPKRKTVNSNKTDGIICGVPSNFLTTPKTAKKRPKKTGWAGGVRGKKKRKNKQNTPTSSKLPDCTSPRRSLRHAVRQSKVDESSDEDGSETQSNLSATASIPKFRIRGLNGISDQSDSDDELSKRSNESPAPFTATRPSAKSRLKAELMECSRNNSPTPSDLDGSNIGTSIYNDEESRVTLHDEEDEEQSDEGSEDNRAIMEASKGNVGENEGHLEEKEGNLEEKEGNLEEIEENIDVIEKKGNNIEEKEDYFEEKEATIEGNEDIVGGEGGLQEDNALVKEDGEEGAANLKESIKIEDTFQESTQVNRMPDALLESEVVHDSSNVKMEGAAQGQAPVAKEEPDDCPLPWDQPLFHVDLQVANRWHIVCQTLEDWDLLVQSFSTSKSRNEKELYKLLSEEFHPTIKEIYEQKEKERLSKYAELNRRSSNRLEFKKLQREDEAKSLAAREAAERKKLAQVEAAKLSKEHNETRHNRYKLREVEKEKLIKLKEKKKEERGKRLEIRRKRQELQRLGLEVPPELMNVSADGDESESDPEDEEESENMHSQLEKIIEHVSSCKDSTPFTNPVTEEIAPDYYQIVKTPMCISMIDRKIREKEYGDKMEFVDDMNTMFLNCLLYNGVQSDYTKLAQRLERAFIKAWKKYFPPSDLVNMSVEQQKYEFKCINMMGKLDKQIRHTLLGESSSSEEEVDVEGEGEGDASLPPKATSQFSTHSYARPSPTQLRHRTAEIKPIPRQREQTSAFHSAPHRFAPYRMGAAVPAPHPIAAAPSSYTPKHHSTFNQNNTGPSKFFSSLKSRGQVYSPYSINNYREDQPERTESVTVPISNNSSKPTVYLLPMSDGGHRMLKFVTKDGHPAPAHLVDQVLPALRQQAHTLPKGVVTVTLDTMQETADEPLPSTSSNPSQQTHPEPQTCVSSDKELREQASAVASELSHILSNTQSKLFGLGNEQFLTVTEGQPWILKKEENGNYKKIQKIDKSQLEAKLRQIQLRKSLEKQSMESGNKTQNIGHQNLLPIVQRPAPQKTTLTLIPPPIPPVNSSKPVCSVAPQIQTQVRPPPTVNLPEIRGSNLASTTNKVYVIDNARRSAHDASPRLIQVNAPVILTSPNYHSTSQVIQLSMPQIAANAATSASNTVLLQDNDVQVNAANNQSETEDLLAEAWQATEDVQH